MPENSIEDATFEPPKAADREAGVQLMEEVGQRLRAARASRGMTRRALAKDADVSERYLAEIENGKANLSLLVLCRVAKGLSLDPLALLKEVEDPLHPPLAAFLAALSPVRQSDALNLLRQHMAPSVTEALGVALIGLRGAGKSSLGRRLAERSGCPFVCLTDRIQQLGGIGIDEIFSLGGQKLYRRLERDALEAVIDQGGPLVLETGGSLVSESDTYARLLEHFHTVWVQASPKEHMDRVVAQGDLRPMHGNEQAMEDLRRILAARGPLYAAANTQLDTSGRKLEESLKSLTEISQEYLPKPIALDPEAAKRA